MKYRVQIIKDAEDDLFEIYTYVALNDSVTRAENLLDKLIEVCQKLFTHPHRGHIPPELKRIDVYDYLEIHYKPYHIIYRIISQDVYIHCILDGRRDLEDLLRTRLLR
jgi:toxin ParE1/3/4